LAVQKLPLSAFIICMNEEAYLANCIESLGLCSEIVIVDSGSTDGTIKLIEQYIADGWPIRFMQNDWPGYAAQKQFALEQCNEPWSLSIDSDERLDDELIKLMPELLNVPEQVAGWRIARRPFLIGYGYTKAWAHERRNLRLIRKDRGAFDLNLKVHEGIIQDGEVRNAKAGSLLHFRPLPIEEQILKENKYSSLKVDMRRKAGKKPSVFKLLFNPPIYFLRLYFKTGLWSAGVPGFIQAVTGAVYSFLTEAKMFEKRAMEKPLVDDLDKGTKT